ncbi:hypothetical protein OIU77_002186 [Salix suchowensis]|uniref:B box-type domain-containing protein n=1 Tax=Salix suchowensis TaxID=1278906 RepID=A0ABQ9B3W8_9ROSI|nr:hypothetical protein OIU77_002186 [Salix suchowensis]
MKIQCDVCEKASATVICCADEAALCAKCDIEVHAANKLASKHQRLLLQCFSNKLPSCDICQEKTAFIFCVEDRALFCRDCDEPVHSAGSLSANHQRFLATGIRVALSSSCSKDTQTNSSGPPNQKFEWLADMGLFGEQLPQETLAAAEVPQLPISPPANANTHRPTKFSMPHKKPRIEISDDDDEFFTVPDLG